MSTHRVRFMAQVASPLTAHLKPFEFRLQELLLFFFFTIFIKTQKDCTGRMLGLRLVNI